MVTTLAEEYLKIKYSRKEGENKSHRNQRGWLIWSKKTKREQPGILPRSMLWTKSHKRSGRIGGKIGEGEVVDKGLVEGIETRLCAFVVQEIISSVIVWNGRTSVVSTIKIDSKGRETPSLAPSSYREYILG